MDPKEARRAMIDAARKKRLQEGTNMFNQEVTVREPPLGLPNLGYLKNPPNVPKPEFLNSKVSLNNLTRQRPEWSGKAYRTPLAQRLNTPYYGMLVPNKRNKQKFGPQYTRNANPIPVYRYKEMYKGTTGFSGPSSLTSTNASNAVNRAKLVEKEVSEFPEGEVRVPEAPVVGRSGCFGGFCLWGGNMKKTRNRRRTKKNARRRSTRRRR
jgi:hypothetical protein